MRRALLLALGGTLLVGGVGHAQTFAIAPAVGLTDLSDSDFANLTMGFEYSLAVRYTLPNRIGFGLEASVSEHPVVAGAETVHLAGLYVEPQYELRLRDSTVEPVFGAELGIVHDWTTSGTQSLVADGVAVGLMGGMRMRVSNHLAVEPEVAYSRLMLGNVVDNGFEVAGSSARGGSLRVAVALLLIFGAGAPVAPH